MTVEKYYTVTEACGELGIEPHVLRYWEGEFDIRFKRNSAGRRIISPDQLAKLGLIKQLLHKERLTIKGARRRLSQPDRGRLAPAAVRDPRQSLLWLKRELLGLKSLVGRLPAE